MFRKRVGFCSSGILSGWDFVQVGFCPVGFCPSGILSCGILSVHRVTVMKYYSVYDNNRNGIMLHIRMGLHIAYIKHKGIDFKESCVFRQRLFSFSLRTKVDLMHFCAWPLVKHEFCMTFFIYIVTLWKMIEESM